MLTGERAFRGETAVETMNPILKEDPPELRETNANVPPGLQQIVGHCLEKNPNNRFQSARDIAFALSTVLETSGAVTISSARKKSRWILAVLAVLIAASLIGSFLLGKRIAVGTASESGIRTRQLTFRRGTVWTARFTPNGQTIVYDAMWDGKPIEIFSTRTESPESRPLDIAADLADVSAEGELAVIFRVPAAGWPACL